MQTGTWTNVYTHTCVQKHPIRILGSPNSTYHTHHHDTTTPRLLPVPPGSLSTPGIHHGDDRSW